MLAVIVILLLLAALAGILGAVIKVALGVALGVFLGVLALTVFVWWRVRRRFEEATARLRMTSDRDRYRRIPESNVEVLDRRDEA